VIWGGNIFNFGSPFVGIVNGMANVADVCVVRYLGNDIPIVLRTDGTVFSGQGFLINGLSGIKDVAECGEGVIALKTDGSLIHFPLGTDTPSVDAVSAPGVVTKIAGSPTGITGIARVTETLIPSSSSVISGSTKALTGKVALSGPLDEDVTFSLTSSDPTKAKTPATVKVLAGSTSATFSITHNLVSTNTDITILATSPVDGSTCSTPVTLVPLTPTRVVLETTNIEGGQTVNGYVDLNATPRTALTGIFDKGSAPVSIAPFTVWSSRGFFTMSSSEVFSTQPYTLQVGVNGHMAPVNYVLLPKPAVKSITFDRPTVYGLQNVTGTVTLAVPARYPGATVTLASTAGATVSSNIFIPQGETSGTFPISTDDVSLLTTSTITASSGASARGVPLKVRPLVVSSISVSPTGVLPGGSVNVQVTLNAIPDVDAPLVFNSPDGLTTFGSNTTVHAGDAGVTNTATISATATGSVASITISRPGKIVTGTIHVVQVKTVHANPLYGTQTGTGTVTLTATTPVALDIPVQATGSGVTVTSVAHIDAGSSSGTFTLQADDVSATAKPTLTAPLGGTSVSGVVTVYPLRPVSITCAPGGRPGLYSVTVTLNAAPGIAIDLPLTCSNPLILNATGAVHFVAGNGTGHLFATAISNGTVKLSVTRGGTTKSIAVTITK